MTETRADPSVIADAESGGRDVSRRSVVKGALAIAAGVITRPTVREDTTGRRGQSGPRVAVIGAGCFGGWTALMLQRRGARVTLVDTWGAGNSRASSGDETRVIRSIYDGNALYTDLVTRAFGLWIDEAKHWGRAVYRKTGAIWIFEGDDAFARGSVPLMRERGIPVEQLSLDEAARRFPQIRFDGARTVYVESEAGFLLARQSCELVRQSVVDAGGAYRQVRAIPGKMGASGLDGVRLANGEQLQADAYVFACGPWMGAVFPEVIGRGIIATRQDVLYFGTPPDDRRFDDDRFPVWVNFGARLMYGIPGNERRGFKVADDTLGGEIDPSTMNRVVSPDALRIARLTLARRFPALRQAPLVESRVCQYEYSPDGDFLVDRHPGAPNVWLLGGGSGHGFKMGPALGEYVARLVLDGATTAPQFSYEHFREGRTRLKRDGVRKQRS